MVGISIKDIDFLEIEERFMGGLAEVIADYLNEKITYNEALGSLRNKGIPLMKSKELLEKGLSSL